MTSCDQHQARNRQRAADGHCKLTIACHANTESREKQNNEAEIVKTEHQNKQCQLRNDVHDERVDCENVRRSVCYICFVAFSQLCLISTQLLY